MTTDAAAIAHRLAAALGHSFARPDLLAQALTHASVLKRGRRRAAPQGYERLEFLGDRVLGLVVADMLWHRFPNDAEGALTRRHTQLVRRETLAEVAGSIGLGEHILLSPGEAAAQTRESATVLADVCEAVIAALYLDGGLPAAEQFIKRYWTPLLETVRAPPRDPKTALQEWAQARGKNLPRYHTVKVEGPPHERLFTVTATVDGLPVSSAQGTSKRGAELAAAAALLDRIEEDEKRS